MIGIFTRYRTQDATLAALALARRLTAQARPFTLFRRTHEWRSNTIDPAYDNRVEPVSGRRLMAAGRHVVTTSPLDFEYLDRAHHGNVKTTLYTSWEQLSRYDEELLPLYTHVLVPSPTQAVYVKERVKLSNLAVVPYDSGLPHTVRRCGGPDRCRLFLSLYGPQMYRVDFAVVLILAALVRDNKTVSVTVACANGPTPYTRRELRKLAAQYPGRWVNRWHQPWADQALEMGRHDLTVWPAKWDGTGVIGATSLAMGTPVIGWDVAPINEVVANGRNGILVETEADYNWLGMPTVRPRYAEFERILRWLVDTKGALDELHRHTAEHLEERRTEFRAGWDAVLPPAE